MNSLASQPGTTLGPAPQESDTSVTSVTSGAPDRVRVLVDRLDAGWTLIDAEPDLARKVRLEEQWIGLLREYETVCDGVATGAAGVSR